MPLDVNIAAQSVNKELNDKEVADKTQYRASIVFSIDNNEDAVTYMLYTNEVLVTPPPCHAGPKGPSHEVHLQEMPRYRRDTWPGERPKDHSAEDFEDDDVMVINAIENGAEVLALS